LSTEDMTVEEATSKGIVKGRLVEGRVSVSREVSVLVEDNKNIRIVDVRTSVSYIVLIIIESLELSVSTIENDNRIEQKGGT